jgi:hypothetical protein
MDNIAGSVAFLESQEIVNNNRTTNYIRNGYGPQNLRVVSGCDCPDELIIPLIGCDPVTGAVTGYNSPAADPAPWYDPAYPESANFTGFYAENFEGIGSTFTREVFPLIEGGGLLGRLRAQPRSLTWRGFLFGKTCCGVAYGLRWLTAQLSQTRCGAECIGEQLDLLMCCPEKEIEDAQEAEPVLSDAEVAASFSDRAFRSLYRVGLVEGPLVLSERQTSCGCGCSTIMEIEFTLVAGNPNFYREPIILADCTPFPAPTDCPWVESDDPADCTEEECPEPEPCTADPNCPQPSLPTIVTDIDECVCEPLVPVERCVSIPASTYGRNFQGVPIFEVFSGSTPTYSTKIRIIRNAIGADCDVLAEDPCLACTTIQIRFIPANSTLVIDGVNRRITIECPGGEVQPGEPFLAGAFTWPVFECIDYCVCVEVDGLTAADDACFSVAVVPREA